MGVFFYSGSVAFHASVYWWTGLRVVCSCQAAVADYVSGGELFTHLVQRVRFKEQEVALYSGEIVLALEHLHQVRAGGSSAVVWLLDAKVTATNNRKYKMPACSGLTEKNEI